MGDSRRHEVFADFIRRNFGKSESILVVADGKGYLAAALCSNYKIRVIEPKARQEIFRKKVKYQKGLFSWTDKFDEDLIIGMHPDEATSEIVKGAIRMRRPFAIVPCCIKGNETHGINGFKEWILKLRKLAQGHDIREGILKISGANTVLWGYPKRSKVVDR